MTVTELSTAMVSEKPHDWRNNEAPNLPTFAPNKMANRLEAKGKMRLSVQMARMRAKLPDEEKQLPLLTIPKTTEKSDVKSQNTDEKSEIAVEGTPLLLPPPAPCNACMPSESREYVKNLLKTDSDSDDEAVEIPKKSTKSTKRVGGWDSTTSLLCKKPTTAVDNRSLNTAKSSQRRGAFPNNFAADVKVKINLYDRYTANAAAESFKFFHYSDLRLYIKQYRRNHSCGLGNRQHVTNVSPIYDANLQKYDYGYERVRSYLKTNDGFMLGLNPPQAHTQVWKANAPITSSLHQKLIKERKQSQQAYVVEEPILSPRVFVSQNLAFSHLWKTKEDGTPDPYIAVTRPPTTQTSQRPTPTREAHKENTWSKTPNQKKSSPGHDSPGDLNKETPTWRIIQMIASCSRRPSRTDGSSSTTTNDFKSKTSDTDSNRGLEKSPDTGGTLSSSTSPDDTANAASVEHNNRISTLKKKYGLLSNIQALSGDRPVVYNNTRSILSNMSNLLTYYIETEADTATSPRQHDSSKINHAEKEGKDVENRKQLLLLRKELKNIASRRSPSRQNFPSSAELAKVGSLVLPSHKNSDLDPPRRCSTSLQSKPSRPTTDRRRKFSPSPVKSGYSGYKKVISMAEQKEGDDKPILFVKRSQLLPTVASSVESMKSKQVMLHTRNLQPIHSRHPADSKQFTKITDLLKSHGVSRTMPSTATGGRRIIHTGFSKGYRESIRPAHSSDSRRK